MKRIFVTILLVAACGGSGDDGGPKQTPREAYIAGAEQVCANANRLLAEATKEKPAGVKEVPGYVHRVVQIASRNVQSLGFLTPPAADVPALQAKMLLPLRQQLRDAEAYDAKVAAAAKANNGVELLRLVTDPPTETRVDLAFMKSYGFKDCVKAADTANASK